MSIGEVSNSLKIHVIVILLSIALSLILNVLFFNSDKIVLLASSIFLFVFGEVVLLVKNKLQ